MGLDCGGRMGQIILVIINIIFMLMGLGLLVPGIALQTNFDFVTDEIKPVLDEIRITGVGLGDVIQNLGIGFIIVGLFVFLVATIGLLGACCKSKCILTIYAIIVLVLLLSQVIVVILWFTMQNTLNSTVKGELTTVLTNNYREDSINGTSQQSNGWNYLFITLKCCGINAVSAGTAGDFQNTPNWSGKGASQKIPTSCCQGVTAESYTASANCTDSVAAGTYYEQGCYDAMIAKFDTSRYSNILLGTGITIIIIELIAIISSILICRGNFDEGNLA
ncbi:tetraspanin-9-like [Saccostrea echinata]|uniref:tetraspanin-9-like n=1 Tax=Saccostrea echinata TaxID=191078 RepID=UPI002A837AE9|nr:tetraspanin-9-like [Saccostrea echinata]